MLLRLRSGSYAIVLAGPAMECNYKKVAFCLRRHCLLPEGICLLQKCPWHGLCDLAGRLTSGSHKLPEIALERGSKHLT